MQDTIENALQGVPPENRDEMRSYILFDPRPMNIKYKKLIA